jgi:hypothetical protein
VLHAVVLEMKKYRSSVIVVAAVNVVIVVVVVAVLININHYPFYISYHQYQTLT